MMKIFHVRKDPEDTRKCNHDPKSQDTTLLKLNIQTFTFPQNWYYICPLCGEGLTFEVDKDMNMKQIDPEEGGENDVDE